jgi:pimeloyl-ACP methyl ester carboxylesterase
MVPLARRLGEKYRALVFSLPGYGHSAALPAPYDLDRSHEVLEQAIASRVESGVRFVGFSGGGWRAIALALRGRTKVEAIACLGGLAGLDQPGRDGLAALAALLRDEPEDARAAAASFLCPAHAQAHPEHVQEVAAWFDAISAPDLANELDAFALSADLRPKLGALHMPVLARAGALDAAVPSQASREIASSVRNGSFELVPNAGHSLLLEDFDATSKSIEQFLAATF